MAKVQAASKPKVALYDVSRVSVVETKTHGFRPFCTIGPDNEVRALLYERECTRWSHGDLQALFTRPADGDRLTL